MSIKRRLGHAADLLRDLKINDGDVISISCSIYELTFFLEWEPLAKLFVRMKLPRKSLQSHVSIKGDLHIDFDARGARFTGMVRKEEAEKFHAMTAEQRALPAAQKLLALPS